MTGQLAQLERRMRKHKAQLLYDLLTPVVGWGRVEFLDSAGKVVAHIGSPYEHRARRGVRKTARPKLPRQERARKVLGAPCVMMVGFRDVWGLPSMAVSTHEFIPVRGVMTPICHLTPSHCRAILSCYFDPKAPFMYDDIYTAIRLEKMRLTMLLVRAEEFKDLATAGSLLLQDPVSYNVTTSDKGTEVSEYQKKRKVSDVFKHLLS